MKCLSICQPFAELIIQNRKTVELRTWNTNFRGEFLVHAPIKIRKEEYKKLKIKSHNLEKNQVKFQGLLFFFQSKYTDPDFSNLSTKFPNIVFHFYIDGELDLRTSRSCLKYFFKSGVEENYK